MPKQDQPNPGPGDEHGSEPITYTVEDVARMLGTSPRWVANKCSTGEIEHVHLARKRKFTKEQVKRVLEQYTVKGPDFEAERAAQERIARRVEVARIRSARNK